RGMGPDKTIVKFTGSDGCYGIGAAICIIGSTYNPNDYPFAGVDWTAGYAQGTTVITLAQTSGGGVTGLAVNKLLMLDQLDDSSDTGGIVQSDQPWAGGGGSSAGRPGRTQTQIVRVTAINGNQVTISPGLYMPNWRAGQHP